MGPHACKCPPVSAGGRVLRHHVFSKSLRHSSNIEKQLISVFTMSAQMVKNLPAMQETQVRSLG